jgi:hypothetical protein
MSTGEPGAGKEWHGWPRWEYRRVDRKIFMLSKDFPFKRFTFFNSHPLLVTIPTYKTNKKTSEDKN